MKKIILKTALIMLISLASCDSVPQVDTEAEKNETTRADKLFDKAIFNEDTVKMIAWLVENSKIIFPDGTVEDGKNEIIKGLGTAFKDEIFSVKRQRNEVVILGDGSACT